MTDTTLSFYQQLKNCKCRLHKLGVLAVADIPTGEASGALVEQLMIQGCRYHHHHYANISRALKDRMESDSTAFSQEDVIALHLGHLLFNEDFDAIARVLLPSHEASFCLHSKLEMAEQHRTCIYHL